MKLFDWLKPSDDDVDLSRRKLFSQAAGAAVAAPLVAKAVTEPASPVPVKQEVVEYASSGNFIEGVDGMCTCSFVPFDAHGATLTYDPYLRMRR